MRDPHWISEHRWIDIFVVTTLRKTISMNVETDTFLEFNLWKHRLSLISRLLLSWLGSTLIFHLFPWKRWTHRQRLSLLLSQLEETRTDELIPFNWGFQCESNNVSTIRENLQLQQDIELQSNLRAELWHLEVLSKNQKDVWFGNRTLKNCDCDQRFIACGNTASDGMSRWKASQGKKIYHLRL